MALADDLYNEADKLKDEGKIDEAIAKLREGLASDPNHVITLLGLSKYLGLVQKFDEAIEHGKKAIELEPDDIFNYTALSVIYQRAGKIQEAEDMLARSRMMSGH